MSVRGGGTRVEGEDLIKDGRRPYDEDKRRVQDDERKNLKA